MVIRRFTHDPEQLKFKFFWMMQVRGVDLSVHCQPCLRGTCSKKIRTSMIANAEKSIDLQDVYVERSKARYIYICGVTTDPYDWSKNLHIALRRQVGAKTKVEWHGTEVEIDGAESLSISANYIPSDCGFADNKAYMTCRNVQFAWGVERGLYLPKTEGKGARPKARDYGRQLHQATSQRARSRQGVKPSQE